MSKWLRNIQNIYDKFIEKVDLENRYSIGSLLMGDIFSREFSSWKKDKFRSVANGFIGNLGNRAIA